MSGKPKNVSSTLPWREQAVKALLLKARMEVIVEVFILRMWRVCAWIWF